jgi:hypothetical protein
MDVNVDARKIHNGYQGQINDDKPADTRTAFLPGLFSS